MKRCYLILCAFCDIAVTGCVHELEYLNLAQYDMPIEVDSRQRGLVVKINYENLSHDEQVLGHEIAECLRRYAHYEVNEDNRRNARLPDVDLRLSVNCERSAPGFTNWLIIEGNIILAPMWHGFEYSIEYKVQCDLQGSVNGTRIGYVTEQFNLDMRYSDTETAMLGISAPYPFHTYNGAIDSQLDKDAVPIMAKKVAIKIIRMINEKNWESADSLTTY